MKDIKTILLEKLVINQNFNINEKLIINKNTKVKKELSESEVDDLIKRYDHNIGLSLWHDLKFKSPAADLTNENKMKYYMDKGSKPERLVATIKNKEKLVKRWNAAMDLEWVDAANVFKEEIIKRGYYDNSELMSHIVSKVKRNREKYKVFLQ